MYKYNILYYNVKDYFLKTIKIKNELENEIITVQFEKPNITVKSFLNHLDLKLSPLKHWTLKKSFKKFRNEKVYKNI